MNPLTGVFGESWEMYRAHWRHFILIALAIFIVVALLSALLVAVLGWLGTFLAGLVSIAGTFWLQGALVEAVRDVRDGRADLSVRDTIERVLPYFNRITIAGILAGLGIGLGFVLLIVPGLVLLTFWVLIVPAIVLEGRGTIESFGRSRELVSGNGWNVFWVIVLTFLLVVGLSIVVSAILAPLADWLAALISRVVANAVVGPFVVATWTLVYYRLRLLESSAEPAAAPHAGE